MESKFKSQQEVAMISEFSLKFNGISFKKLVLHDLSFLDHSNQCREG